MTVEETCTDDKKGRTTGRGSRESIQKQGAGDTGKPCRAFVLALPSISASKAMGFLSSSDRPGGPTCYVATYGRTLWRKGLRSSRGSRVSACPARTCAQALTVLGDACVFLILHVWVF